MPTVSKGVRLWWRKPRRNKAGKVIKRGTWIIIDDRKHHATGCFAGETERAQQKLAAYIAAKYKPKRKERPLDQIKIADVLSIYLDFKDPDGVNTKLAKRIGRLNDHCGNDTLDQVNGDYCRDYAKKRGNEGGSRRDLEDFRAAIRHHQSEGYHRENVKVALPAKGEARDRWFERSEAAHLLWTCWRHREIQTIHRGPRKGQKVETDKRPLRHLARFIIIGLRMGNRAATIASASPIKGDGRSFVDLDRGVFYRLPQGKKETNKRQPPAPIPPRLLAHMRRWVRKGIAVNHFVEWNGKPVKSVKTSFKTAVKLARIEHASPHTLRHTAATWLMQNGAPMWEAAGFLGMSEKTLRETYGHHHPDFMSGAIAAIEGRPIKNDRLVVRLAERMNQQKPGA
ncbi:tyrosine-type recombinase/integrase [Pseudorhodoplanes sinuspersici]|uniref:Integrase n=1 Tax=Pseudorhodoplanes sinuspersici TaxID=1235591 RepID=A0A1W6ZRV5_9HYPH|nr:tyrosine-type recombinase/integrase [Pseudorhodoplanes sinuspersici]ARQ00092.1 integrase [Pseudorhodoplanes sinuspersici]RKE71136.1 site-specific recombinase XerD [Pseudorhodoplanes sinuspersici]